MNRQDRVSPSIATLTRRRIEVGLGITVAIAVGWLNKEKISALISTDIQLSVLVSINLIFVLWLAYRWFIYADKEAYLLNKQLIKPITNFEESLSYIQPITLGIIFGFFLANTFDVVWYVALSMLLQIIAFIGDCVAVNVIEKDIVSTNLDSYFSHKSPIVTDVVQLVKETRRAIADYYLSGMYFIRVPFFFIIQMIALYCAVNSTDHKGNMIPLYTSLAYLLALMGNVLNEISLEILRYNRYRKISKYREDFKSKSHENLETPVEEIGIGYLDHLSRKLD